MVIFNEEELRQIAPAAFATEPEKGKVSERYEFLPTTTIIEMLQDEGWRWTSAQQVRSRTWSTNHAKHIIRLRHEDLTQHTFDVGDSIPEMVIVNAHNGLGGYQLRAGVFRLVCSNGMIVSEQDFGQIRLRHIGFEREQVVEASRQVITNAAKMAEKVGSWQEISLSDRSRKDFFADAARLRFGDNTDDDLIHAVSQPRREADRGNDLWRTFNVAQENLIRGGFRREKTNRMVREVTNINANVNLNQNLWDLASTYANN